jgi:crossover junction endodeoxyribonuclease RuvC
MSTRGIIAIDPGIGGALALLIDGEYSDVAAMPIAAKKSGRNQVDAHGLMELLDDFAGRADTVDCLIELVSAMPGQGVSSMFSLGDSFGVVRALGTSYAHRVAFVTPAVWKRKAMLSRDKAYSLTLARDAFPAASARLRRQKDEGLAEALLLAKYGFAHHPW